MSSQMLSFKSWLSELEKESRVSGTWTVSNFGSSSFSCIQRQLSIRLWNCDGKHCVHLVDSCTLCEHLGCPNWSGKSGAQEISERRALQLWNSPPRRRWLLQLLYISKNTCCEDGLVCSGKLKHILVIGQDAYKSHRCKPDLGPKGSPCTKKSECPSSGPYSYGHWVSCQVLAGEADQHPHCCIQSYNNSWGSEGWKNFWFTSLNYGAASDGKRGKVTHNTSCCSGKSATLEGSIGPVCIDWRFPPWNSTSSTQVIVGRKRLRFVVHFLRSIAVVFSNLQILAVRTWEGINWVICAVTIRHRECVILTSF